MLLVAHRSVAVVFAVWVSTRPPWHGLSHPRPQVWAELASDVARATERLARSDAERLSSDPLGAALAGDFGPQAMPPRSRSQGSTKRPRTGDRPSAEGLAGPLIAAAAAASAAAAARAASAAASAATGGPNPALFRRCGLEEIVSHVCFIPSFLNDV